MENEYRAEQRRMETENQALIQKISKMEKNNQELKGGLTTLQPTTTAHLNGCDEGWESFRHHCYLFVKQVKTWDDASAFCESKNSYLIELTTDAEFHFASEMLGGSTMWWSWIGATDRGNEGTFVYQHSKRRVPEKYWRQGEPANRYDHSCVFVMYFRRRNRVYILLSVNACSSTLDFVCEKP